MINLAAPFRGWTRRKTGYWLAMAVLAYGLFGLLVAPPLLKMALERRIPLALHRRVAIGTVRLNPFTLAVEIDGFRLARKEGPGNFVSFERLDVNFDAVSLLRRALIVKSVTLTHPIVTLIRTGERTYNFSDLLAPSSSKAKRRGPALFSINDLEIIGGTIRYQDRLKGVTHQITELHLAIPSISDLPSHIESTVQPAFSAVINGTPVSLAGGSTPFSPSRATEVSLKASGIDVPEYLAYLPNPTGLTVTSALLDLDANLSYRVTRTSRLSLSGTFTLRQVEVADREGHPVLTIPSLTVVLSGSDLLARKIGVAEIAVDSPHLEIARLPGGKLLPFSLLAAPGSAAPKVKVKAAAAQKPPAGPRFGLTIGRFRLTNGQVDFTDRTLKEPGVISLGPITLTAGPLSTLPRTASTVDLSLGMNGTGDVSGKGILTLAPLDLKAKLAVDSLEVAGFQPYLSKKLRGLLAGGKLALRGDLEVKPDAAGAPGVSFTGQGAVTDLTATDPASGEDLLKWKKLRARNIVFSSSPLALAIREIRLREPFAKVLIAADGTSSLTNLLRRRPARAAHAKTKAGSPAKITIANMAIQDGTFLFQDRSIHPAYGAEVGQLNGTIAGLSSHRDSRAMVKLDGWLDQAPLTLFGQVNLLGDSPLADLTLDCKDFSLGALSPYSGKYAGRKIEKGRLSLDALYQVRGSRLEGSIKAFLDQLTLGERVESPDATPLPVGLAVALLQDRNGEIALDIPVEGDLKDPRFSVRGAVGQFLLNLFAKAATSPFALLGSLVPRGEDLQYVPFAPGRAELSGEAAAKLAAMADVLQERPELRVDVTGHTDPELDRQALARERLLYLIKLEKLKRSWSRRKTGVQNVVVSAGEYPSLLKRVYDRALEAAPASERALARKARPASQAEEIRLREGFVLRSIRIRSADLRLLALDRANAVVSQLVNSGKIAPGQLLVAEPKLAKAGTDQAKGPQTVAEMVMK
ncbi:MAG: DUF748 domain-containing protein [Desulfobacteraceae bacterium]|nr:DUF748 domain-containing protein [Desulfobacteraceae bacterium]